MQAQDIRLVSALYFRVHPKMHFSRIVNYGSDAAAKEGYDSRAGQICCATCARRAVTLRSVPCNALLNSLEATVQSWCHEAVYVL